MAIPFLTPAAVESDGPDRWWLIRPLTYQGHTDLFTMPVGFSTDFSTVPAVWTWAFPKTGAHTRATVLHDWLLVSQTVSRADADGIFRRTLREAGLAPSRYWPMWAAVRLAGRMRGATAADWGRLAVIAALAVPLLAVPAVIVGAWTVAWWLLDLAIPGQASLPQHPTHTAALP